MQYSIPGDRTFYLDLGADLSVTEAQAAGLRVLPDGQKHPYGEHWQAELRAGAVVTDPGVIAAIRAQNIPLVEAA